MWWRECVIGFMATYLVVMALAEHWAPARRALVSMLLWLPLTLVITSILVRAGDLGILLGGLVFLVMGGLWCAMVTMTIQGRRAERRGGAMLEVPKQGRWTTKDMLQEWMQAAPHYR